MVALRLAAAGRQRRCCSKKSAKPTTRSAANSSAAKPLDYLHQAGVDPRRTRRGRQSASLRLSSGAKSSRPHFPFRRSRSLAASSMRLLLARAAEHGCQVHRGIAVESLTARGDVWLLTLNNGELFSRRTSSSPPASTISAASRARPPSNPISSASKCIGNSRPPDCKRCSDRMELFLFPGGYGGLSLIEDNIAQSLPCHAPIHAARASADGRELLAAHPRATTTTCARSSTAPSRSWPRPLAISPIPYGYLAPRVAVAYGASAIRPPSSRPSPATEFPSPSTAPRLPRKCFSPTSPPLSTTALSAPNSPAP